VEGAAVDVHISIVNHENRELVRACLESLPEACNRLAYRTTVVDNVSCDGSLEMLAQEFPDVLVMANARRLGFGANHNQVLRTLLADGSARYALILNDDTVLRPGAVAAMVARLDADPRAAAAVPTIEDEHGRVAASRLAYPTARTCLVTDWTDRTEPADPGGFLQGCCLLLRLAAIAEVGMFDERFFLFYEDTDLSRRLAEAGWELVVCSDAVVYHVGHASVFKPGYVELTPRQGRRSRYLYLAKHHGRVQAELITALGRLLLLVRAVKASAGWHLLGDGARRDRARRLFGLVGFNPRRPLPAERAASDPGAPPRGGPGSPPATDRSEHSGTGGCTS
jgi:GT2 family glycosyltransferase